ncbi:MAG: YbaB/EbfC family nucleoid-associated protein [Saprospiraceae bacterium]
MFGDMLGNMEKQQAEMQKKLALIEVSGSSGDGAVHVKANATGQILNIAIDPEKLDWEDKEEVEDLLVIAVNRAIEAAKAKEGEAAQSMMNDMLPGGLGGLADMFGK